MKLENLNFILMTSKVFEYGKDMVKAVLCEGFRARKGRLEGERNSSGACTVGLTHWNGLGPKSRQWQQGWSGGNRSE